MNYYLIKSTHQCQIVIILRNFHFIRKLNLILASLEENGSDFTQKGTHTAIKMQCIGYNTRKKKREGDGDESNQVVIHNPLKFHS